MYIRDTSTFPVVHLSYKAEDKTSLDELFEKFESLLSKNQKFVFVSEGPFAEEDNDHEARKRVGAWVKANRATLSRLIVGLVHTETDEKRRVEAEQFAKIFQQFSGYPMYLVLNKTESDATIKRLLSEE